MGNGKSRAKLRQLKIKLDWIESSYRAFKISFWNFYEKCCFQFINTNAKSTSHFNLSLITKSQVCHENIRQSTSFFVSFKRFEPFPEFLKPPTPHFRSPDNNDNSWNKRKLSDFCYESSKCILLRRMMRESKTVGWGRFGSVESHHRFFFKSSSFLPLQK